MRHLYTFSAFVLCFLSVVTSNPILDPHYELAITEVHIAGANNWYIELNGRWFFFDVDQQQITQNFPCSSDVYLTISKPNTIYKARVGFNIDRYAVISRSNLKDIHKSQPINIDMDDTIRVALNKENLTTIPPRKYWWFPMKQYAQGNTLVAIGNSNNNIKVFSTSRKTLGGPGNYNTKFEITVRDKYGKPLSSLNVMGTKLNAYIDKSGFFFVNKEINDPETTVIKFSDKFSPHGSNDVPMQPLSLFYSDADTLVRKSISIPVTSYALTFDDPGAPRILTCFLSLESDWFPKANVTSGSPNPLIYRIYPSLPVGSLCFANHNSSPSKGCIGNWSGVYIDTSDVINVVVPLGTTSVSPDKNPGIQSGVSLSALCIQRNEIRFVISSLRSSAWGSVFLYTLSGKVIGNLPFEMNEAGTSTVRLQISEGNLHPGSYICKLIMNGYPPVVSQVTIH